MAFLSRRKRKISAAKPLELRGPNMSNEILSPEMALEIDDDSGPWID
jgi:hypothetical protein